ncbi:porin family protein [Psychromonas sp. RZ22]|uniref:outer membrane protein n=1 Tax=Psychromonas algarum TaxID=2555643 RepID=UPI0010674DB3|nr:outer membrane beta-barrel protein [Psychromonas sp. RZ22]TEW54968.1 porin family protein [Psychromonas sp. RZ22]
MKKIILTTILLSATSLAFSANVMAKGFYLGGAAGTSAYNDGGLSKDYAPSGDKGFVVDNTNPSNEASDTSGTPYSIYGGYYFNRVVGLELSYTDYGDVKNKAHEVVFSPTSIAVAANVGWTFANGLRPFALAGLSHVDMSSADNTVYSALESADGGDVALHVGFGLEYQPPAIPHLSTRLFYQSDVQFVEVTKLSSSSDKVYALSTSALMLGVAYRF